MSVPFPSLVHYPGTQLVFMEKKKKSYMQAFNQEVDPIPRAGLRALTLHFQESVSGIFLHPYPPPTLNPGASQHRLVLLLFFLSMDP